MSHFSNIKKGHFVLVVWLMASAYAEAEPPFCFELAIYFYFYFALHSGLSMIESGMIPFSITFTINAFLNSYVFIVHAFSFNNGTFATDKYIKLMVILLAVMPVSINIAANIIGIASIISR